MNVIKITRSQLAEMIRVCDNIGEIPDYCEIVTNDGVTIELTHSHYHFSLCRITINGYSFEITFIDLKIDESGIELIQTEYNYDSNQWDELSTIARLELINE